MSLDLWLTIDACNHCGGGGQTVHDANITHNLTDMWRAAGVYDALYMSEGKRAEEILPVLEVGVEYMQRNPEECARFNAPNGWGLYEHALPFLEKFTSACRACPKAKVGLWK